MQRLCGSVHCRGSWPANRAQQMFRYGEIVGLPGATNPTTRSRSPGRYVEGESRGMSERFASPAVRARCPEPHAPTPPRVRESPAERIRSSTSPSLDFVLTGRGNKRDTSMVPLWLPPSPPWCPAIQCAAWWPDCEPVARAGRDSRKSKARSPITDNTVNNVIRAINGGLPGSHFLQELNGAASGDKE